MKKLLEWLLAFWLEFKAQVFTLVGLFIAWVLLEGEAKTIVGWATVAAIVIWFMPSKNKD
jgi:hypothetical protein